MNNFRFSLVSLKNMEGVHPDLIKVAELALSLSPVDFGISHLSVRTMAQQYTLLSEGKSHTTKSKHVPENNPSGLSCAIDVIAYDNRHISWEPGLYRVIGQAFVYASAELGTPITLGCLFHSFFDGPHVELRDSR